MGNITDKSLKVSLLTGGYDVHYALCLITGLVRKSIEIELIGNDQWQDFSILKNKDVIYFNLRGDQKPNASIYEKIMRVIKYYLKLIKYAAETDSKLFHIQWLNKFTYFDRTILNIYYKALGKKLIFTAHDINYKKLVGKDTFLNNLSLKFMYKIVDHIIVHTEKMKMELVENYSVKENNISVIPFGINEVMPKTDLTRAQAKQKLKLKDDDKILLFFGNIAPYKGLEYLVSALVNLREKYKDIKLIIAGRIKINCQDYWSSIQKVIDNHHLENHLIKKIEYIHDDDVEIYFKAADVLILPYKNIFQSGLIYTSYHFGLPVVASDAGSLKDDVVSGKTGFICKSENPDDLAEKIILYYNSNLYNDLERTKQDIIKYAYENYSWERTGDKTYSVYCHILRK